jgi:YqaJ-like viral recombinase domain
MARECFENKFDLQVLPAGLFVDIELHFLAGSPDGLVGEHDIVEIKCPHSIKDMNPKDGVLAKKIKYLSINSDGHMELKRNDNYYYQVQGQLRVTNKLSCYFIVWTPKGI